MIRFAARWIWVGFLGEQTGCKHCDDDAAACDESDRSRLSEKHRCLGAIARAALEAAAKVGAAKLVAAAKGRKKP